MNLKRLPALGLPIRGLQASTRCFASPSPGSVAIRVASGRSQRVECGDPHFPRQREPVTADGQLLHRPPQASCRRLEVAQSGGVIG
jgi:hypothetical protein